MAKNRVSEEALLKALDVLEGKADEEVEKSENIPAQMKSTKAANGGFTGQGGAGEKADELETDADENDPSHSAKSDGEEDVEYEDEEEVAKADDEESGDDEEKDDEESSEEEEASKSLRATMEEDDTVSKAIEVSDFLEHFVDQTVDSVDGLRKSLVTLRKSQDSFNDDLRQAVVAIGNAVVNLSAKIDAISEQPANPQPRAAMSKSITASAVQGRSFNDGAADDGIEEPMEQFSKSDALEVLISLAQQGKVHPALVTQYETTSSLPPEVQRLVETNLRRN